MLKKLKIIIAVLGMAPFLFWSIINLSPNCPTSGNQPKATDSDHKTNDTPQTSQIAKPDSKETANNSESPYDTARGSSSWVIFADKWIGDPIALFTYYILCITGGLAYYTLKLWRSTRKLVRETAETSKRELRAYLGIQEHRVQMPGTIPQIYLLIKNTGSTPAKDVRIAISFERRPNNAPRNFPPPAYEEGRRPLAPQGTWEVRRVMREIKQHTETINRTHRIFVWGAIEYGDIFDGPLKYVHFRFRSDEMKFINNMPDGWTLATTEEGNTST